MALVFLPCFAALPNKRNRNQALRIELGAGYCIESLDAMKGNETQSFLDGKIEIHFQQSLMNP